MKIKQYIVIALVAFLVGFAPVGMSASNSAGKVLYTKGVVSGQSEGTQIRFLAKGEAFFVGDQISTGKKSFAVVEFADGTKMTIRPESVFVIDEYLYNGSEEKAFFSLVKGGLRALTGLMGKRNTDAYRIRTPIATLGIRGTEFDMRLCGADCAAEQAAAAIRKDAEGSRVIARVAAIEGDVKAENVTGSVRKVAMGGPVYEGDTLRTPAGAYAVVVFRDDTRVTVQPQSEFVVQKYAYDPKTADTNSALFNLTKGAVRASAGALAQAALVRTSEATAGIRGQGFDVCYQNPTHARAWRDKLDFQHAGHLDLTEVPAGSTRPAPG